MRERFQAVGLFFADVGAEMKKTTWPTRHELWDSTVVVIVMVILTSTFIALCDGFLVGVLKVMFP
ncbi:MAG: preprotein translocase subunit SecE [Lentisphaerae bacterium RIFOXYC12_FULL_60_16]|nr:MAG: preprotein translocase subunit SecE [Lentisphaerae bacterium RIFOXYC12_FULL_60_16]OGV71159.1 MAG: preprotein translocase subunit SecE [Lentisphaerae bacterium RIFOXYA12_FULL_60_10]OGV77335.1 MAG: preprotein translocase subunit SecE [Lentisphaerae bacterium RIFOXYB12_FULL_60_10]